MDRQNAWRTWVGIPLLTRGQLDQLDTNYFGLRYIPAYAGPTPPKADQMHNRMVYPCLRGAN